MFTMVVLALLLTGRPLFAQEFEKADMLLYRYLESGAAKLMEQIDRDYPDSPHSWFCNAYEMIGVNNDRARELSEAMIEDHPYFAPGYLALGTVLSVGFDDHRKAISQFELAIEMDGEMKVAMKKKCIAHLILREFDDAIRAIDQLMEDDMGNAVYWILNGVAHFGEGDMEILLSSFEIGLQMDFKSLAAVFMPVAQEAVDKAIELAPENIIYLFGRGYARLTSGKYRQASEDFTRAIEMVPGNADFFKYSGSCKLFLEDGEGAQSDLNIALGVNPEDPEIYYYLGVLMNDVLDDPSRAAEYLNNAVELDAQNAGYYYERARSYYKMLNYQAAGDDINRALQYNHRKGDYYALRGNIKQQLGNPSGDFCEDYRKAEEWGTTYNLKRIINRSCR